VTVAAAELHRHVDRLERAGLALKDALADEAEAAAITAARG
jgi:exonuclease VII small subunit